MLIVSNSYYCSFLFLFFLINLVSVEQRLTWYLKKKNHRFPKNYFINFLSLTQKPFITFVYFALNAFLRYPYDLKKTATEEAKEKKTYTKYNRLFFIFGFGSLMT